MKLGKFITMEGLDGSGKTTARQSIVEEFMAADIVPILTREPGGTPLAERVREMVLSTKFADEENFPVLAEVGMFNVARTIHVENLIRPALDAGRLVISDRFVDSTYAYQHAGRGLSMELLEQLHQIFAQGLKPDVVFFFDGSPEVFRGRMALRGEKDRMERNPVEFMERARAKYLDLARKNPEQYIIIDAEQSIEEVGAVVREHTRQLIQEWTA